MQLNARGEGCGRQAAHLLSGALPSREEETAPHRKVQEHRREAGSQRCNPHPLVAASRQFRTTSAALQVCEVGNSHLRCQLYFVCIPRR